MRIDVRTALVAACVSLPVRAAGGQAAPAPGPAWLAGVGIASYALAEVHGTGWGSEGVVRPRLLGGSGVDYGTTSGAVGVAFRF